MLTSWQRKYIRGLAHGLEPVVHVGKNGASAELMTQVDTQLNVHECIKIRFSDNKENKDEIVDHVTKKTSSDCAGIIGHIAILFRPHSDISKRKIKFPKN